MKAAVPGGAATCSEGLVYFFLRVPQAVGLYCSCHAAQASKGNFKKIYYKTFGTSGRPTQYNILAPTASGLKHFPVHASHSSGEATQGGTSTLL